MFYSIFWFWKGYIHILLSRILLSHLYSVLFSSSVIRFHVNLIVLAILFHEFSLNSPSVLGERMFKAWYLRLFTFCCGFYWITSFVGFLNDCLFLELLTTCNTCNDTPHSPHWIMVFVTIEAGSLIVCNEMEYVWKCSQLQCWVVQGTFCVQKSDCESCSA